MKIFLKMKYTISLLSLLAFIIYVLDCRGQQSYIPDDAFEAALIELGLDEGALNDSVPTENIAGVLELLISEKGISDLTGIQDFTSLEVLWVDKNALTSIDLSGNPNLIDANLGINDLIELDISQNLLLETLVLQNNELTELDVSQNAGLIGLNLYSNNISEMDLSQNVNLEWISLSDNTGISEIDVSNLLKLRSLSVYSTGVSEIDVTQNPLLENLNLYNTQISELDVTQNPLLIFLNIQRTTVSELDVTNNPAIYNLYISTTDISAVDISNNPELHRFWIDNDKFQYPELEEIFAAETYEQFKGYFKYAPQQWIGEAVDTTLEEGQSIVFEMVEYRPGTMDTIRWYRDGELLPGQNGKALQLAEVVPGDAGNYYALIKSGVVPEIELQSNIFKLTVDPATGLDPTISKLKIYPNPATECIHFEGVEGIMTLKLFNDQGQIISKKELHLSGTLDVNNCSAGNYYVEIIADDRRQVRKLIIE